MKINHFIYKIGLLAILLLVTYASSIHYLTTGPVDFYYHKFTEKSGSLIIGLSRARDGISPEILEANFENTYKKPLLNFAFERTQSSFGQAYLNAIKQKIDTNSTNGLFIVSVTPGSFVTAKRIKERDSLLFDQGLILSKLSNFNVNPNYEYIRKCYSSSLYRGFLKNKKSPRKIHNNGWIEFQGHLSINQREKIRKLHLSEYSEVIKHIRKSNYKINQFKETINFLKKHGTVVLIRMPMHPEFLEFEDQYWPEFNQFIKGYSEINKTPYFDYSKSNKNYKTVDGSHMFGESAKEFSAQLASDIKKIEN